ncbi:hypothetical protein ACEN9J_02730 [Variovorax sp. Varisp41]|uniref:hypothetical protein n=1 Tax=Variovorax sp. Varisp41 TaxID=3243033 RepID=UPI0039B608B9
MTTDIHAATESLRRCLRDGVLPKSGLLSMFDAIAVDTVLKSHDVMETRAELAECNYVSASEERDMLRTHRDELLAALEARDAEIAALREDAERYRWLRDWLGAAAPLVEHSCSGEDLDAAIDRAREIDSQPPKPPPRYPSTEGQRIARQIREGKEKGELKP